MKKLVSIIGVSLFLIIAGILLIPGIRGTNSDLNYYHNTHNREVGGPFESSGSSSRYALTENIVNKGTFIFTKEEAQFASPDVVGSKGKYFSIFMPGVSIASVPLYKLGLYLGYPQPTAYLLNILFALLNTILIMLIVRKITGGLWIGLFAGLVFLFATNAFVYAFFFTQHHMSTFCLLSILYLCTFPRNLIRNLVSGLLYGYAIFVDIPNAILLFPAMLVLTAGNVTFQKTEQRISVKIKLALVGLALGFGAMLFVIGNYNKITTGSYTSLPQFIGRSEDFSVEESKDPVNKPEEIKQKDASVFETHSPFVTRFLINGFYILLASDERGWLVYSPILFLGILGLYVALRKKESTTFAQLLFSTAIINLLLYAMFGDPWGGWAFGPRYMIPAAATMTILIGYATKMYRGKIVYASIVLVLLAYSTFVNSLGSLTTAQIPPKQEAIYLLNYTPYTYAYNLSLIDQNQIRSMLYVSALYQKISAREYLILYWLTILLFTSGTFMCAVMEDTKKK